MPTSLLIAFLGGYSALITLISSIVLLFMKTQRDNYNARVKDLQAYSAEMLEIMREQRGVIRTSVGANDKLASASQAAEHVMRALPLGVIDS